jgi:hypothetical protein
MCKLISDFNPADCTDLEKGGVTGDLYLINYDDWLTANVTRSTDGTITAIALTETGAKAVKYSLIRGATTPTTPLTINNGSKSGFVHTVATFVPTKDQAVKKELASLINYNRVVALVVLDSGVVCNLFGNDCGLQMTAFEEAPNDPGMGGGIQFTLSTPADVTLENLPPVTVFDTDRATTLAALEALTVAVP